MNSADKDKYFRDIFALARTMVIKIESLAIRYNKALERTGQVVSSDKRTWRYYMNLNGDYHETDEPMMIRSLDTDDEILFSKENLKTHLNTFREYSRGGYWFKRLSERYPAQPFLIRGILSPIPFSETIGAEDYKILRYNEKLVLPNETQLIPKLQTFIMSEVEQLFHHDYIHTDDLFLTLMVRTLYADIIKGIHVIRMEDMYTRHSHEFYIWSHIDSFGNFSQYKNSLNFEQTMWLFRNIAWIKNNPGQQFTFDKLMNNLLSAANIPLAKYDMVEGTENQLEELTPTPLYRRLQLNLIEDYGNAPTYIETPALILKQQPLAKDNLSQTAIYQEDALARGKRSLHSELPTKVLESSMKDYTNRHADTLMSVLMNEWIYLAGKGKYQGRVIVADPKTGRQVRLSVADAYNIWKYLIDYSSGRNPVYICPAYYQNVMKLVPPSLDEIVRIGGPAFIYPLYLGYDIRNLWVPVGNFVAPDYLMQYAIEVYDTMWKHKKLYSQFYDLNKRARVKNACKLMYDSGVIKLGSYERYDELLADYKFDFSDYTAAECKEFAWDIFKRVTGWDVNTQPSMRVKQDDLLEIMMRLSSYTIHVVKEMDDGATVDELINEIFVGDSRWVGLGNKLEGDFQFAAPVYRPHIDPLSALHLVLKVHNDRHPVVVAEMALKKRIDVKNQIKRVELEKDPTRYALRIGNHRYIRRVYPDDPEPTLDELPPTYYGDLSDPIVVDTLPDTYYGDLGDPIQIDELPETYYGDLSDEIVIAELPATYYGNLGTPEKLPLLPNTDYGVLKAKK